MTNRVSKGLRSAAVAIGFLAIGMPAGSAQDKYPSRPVTMIIAAAPGGGTDIIARVVGKQLEAELGQPVIMENRPGGSSVVAADFVARQAPDGYTLLMTFDGHIIGAATTPNLSYHPINSFTPISQVASTEIVLTVREDSPATDMKSFLEWARNYKGNLNGGIPAPNSPFAPAAKSFVDLAGLDAELINNVGSNKTVLGLLGSEYQFAFTSLSTALPDIKESKLRHRRRQPEAQRDAAGRGTHRRHLPWLSVPGVVRDHGARRIAGSYPDPSGRRCPQGGERPRREEESRHGRLDPRRQFAG